VDKFPSRERSAAQTLEPRVTAIVVARAVATNATGQSTLDLCLRSALSEPWVDDLVIVDQANAPAVSSALRALQLDRRDVRVVVADARMSAAAAANLGAAQAPGRWLLFLDSDVVLQRGAVQRMANSANGASAPWIVGGRLTDLEGREKRAARGGALNTFSALAVAMGVPGVKRPRGKRKSSKPLAAASVASVSGAFMLMQREDFSALGGFDEAYLSDAADLDLCKRAADAGGAVLFQAEASGVQFERHRKGRRQAQGLARFAAKSAKTPLEKMFALFAGPAIGTLVGLRDVIGGRQGSHPKTPR
jgi:hypothetical protein